MCCSINMYIYIFFCKCIQIKFSYHCKLFHCYTELYVKMSHVALMEILSKNTYMPCGFLKLLYLNFKVFQSKFDIGTMVFYLKNAKDNSIIFMVGIINISNLKAHFKTTTTMVSTSFKINLIFE